MAITLDTPLEVNAAFLTVGEADSYLENFTSWQALSDEVKIEALIAARYYIETAYSVTLTGTIPEALKYGNAILATDYIVSPTYFQTSPNIRNKRVKAGSVETETEYMNGGKQQPPSWLRVKAILAPVCQASSGLNFFPIRA